MKLKKPIITIIIIILILVDLVFFSFLYLGKEITKKEQINEIVLKFDLKKYILDNRIIEESVNNYRYPEEVFNYLDDYEIKNIKDNFLVNLELKKDTLISSEELKELLLNSVYEYEFQTNNYILDYVSNDIDILALEITNNINNYRDGYFFIEDISNSSLYYISIILLMIGIAIIILVETTRGVLISSIILFFLSFFLYYIENNSIKVLFKNFNNYLDKCEIYYNNFYIICFILGFVLLLIYMYFLIKKIFREIRIKSYSSWR